MHVTNSFSPRSPLLMAGAVLFCALASFVISTPEARADRDQVSRVDFIGWSGVNPDAFCVRIRDPQRGNRIEVRQIGNPTAMVNVPVSPENERQVMFGPQVAPWSCVVPGHPGTTAPNGWLVFGQQEGPSLRVGLSNRKSSIQIGLVQARFDALKNKPAKADVRTAYWSKDSMRVVVIVNHRVTGSSWGLDLDEPHGFKVGK